MTNLTKAIAVLGVVAGLGVAALPLSSYAVTTPVIWSDDGNGGTNYGGAGTEESPMWVAKPVQLELKIEEGIQISVADKAGEGAVDVSKVTLTSTDDENYTADAINVNVIANNKSGYYLNIAGTGKTGNETDLVNANGAVIKAGDLTDSVSEWGYKVGEATTWTGVTKGGAKINESAKPTGAEGQNTLVTFGARVESDQESGIYEGQVTFTATAGAQASTEAGE